jgi:pimeloyl-ACP methyl ester carboxylesterase
VLGYDKRGVGRSEGTCCPGDDGHFSLLAADADGGVNTLRTRTDIDKTHVGLFGISQAGWVVPLAAPRAADRVAFMALVSAPTVSEGEEGLYTRLTSEEGGGDPEPKAEIARRLREQGPSGFDPAPYLRRLSIPGLWVLGGNDLSQPTDADLVVLRRLERAGKDYTAVVIPGAGQGLLDGEGDPRVIRALVEWLDEHVVPPS